MCLMKGFFIYLLVVVCIKQCTSFCKPFDEESGLAASCGYSATVNFTHQSHYDTAIKSIEMITKRFSSCSDYAKLIGCSLNVPRCESYIEGPYLPCKRVCDEFNLKCSDQILKHGMEWIIGMCQVLPKKDDPNTKLGYLGRCFEPPDFKTSIVKSPPLKCSKLIVPACQNIGYTQTVLSEEKQKAYSSWASDKLKAISDKPDCDLPRKKLFCMENFLPCINGTAGSYCRPKCERFYNMNCTPPYKSSDIKMCMDLPAGTVDNDVCIYTDWPKAMNWPQVRNRKQPVLHSTTPKPESTDIKIGPTTEAVIFSSEPTSTEIRFNKTDSDPKHEGANKPKMIAAVVGGVFAVLLVIVIALAIAFVIYRKRSRASRGPRGRKRKDKTVNKLLRY